MASKEMFSSFSFTTQEQIPSHSFPLFIAIHSYFLKILILVLAIFYHWSIELFDLEENSNIT